MDDKLDRNELISALADGQLQGEAFAHAVQAVCADRAALATWHAYHLIGDVLRAGEPTRVAGPQAFVDRLSRRLVQERLPQSEGGAVDKVPELLVARPAANDGSFRWKLVAGVASAAAVAAVGWSMLGAGPTQSQLASASQQPAALLARSDAGMMLRDPKLDELLAAHRQFGGASALQMPAGFVRNATFEATGR